MKEFWGRKCLTPGYNLLLNGSRWLQTWCFSYRPDVLVGGPQQLHDQVDLLDLRGSWKQRFVGQQLGQDAPHCPVKKTSRPAYSGARLKE